VGAVRRVCAGERYSNIVRVVVVEKHESVRLIERCFLGLVESLSARSTTMAPCSQSASPKLLFSGPGVVTSYLTNTSPI
jgi:hypothetical protein